MALRSTERSGIETARARYALARADLAAAQRHLLDDIHDDYEPRKRAYAAALREGFDASEALRRLDPAFGGR